MLDPQAECPECGTKLGSREDCRECGWKPGRRIISQGVEWTPPAFTPPSEEEHAEVLRLIAETSAKLGVARVDRPVKRFEATPRCPACDQGKFLHAGVRYCAACYRKL